MTPDNLTELEHPARIAKASGFTDVSINVDHLLELIAAARELAELKSALDFLCAESDALITVTEVNGDTDSVCTEAYAVLGLAKRLGWKGVEP